MIISYVYSLDVTSIPFVGLLHTGQTLSHIPSPFHSYLFLFLFSIHSSVSPALGPHSNPSISWLAARVWKHLCKRCSPHLIEIRRRTPSLTESSILLPARGGLHQGFLAACRVWCNSWSRSVESSENGTQPSGRKMCEPACLLPKLDTFFFFFLIKLFTPGFRW